MNFLNSDVPDPTDFPPHAIAPGLRDLDSSFRCDICGDLYDAPVTISCGHCFCSTCIRISLSNKQECPTCRKTASEVHIRPNPVVDKVISDWKSARPFVLQLVERLSEGDKTTAKKRKWGASSPESTISGPSRLHSSPVRENPMIVSPWKPKKAKLEMIPSSDVDEEEISISNTHDIGLRGNDLVGCPICERRVKYSKLNEHIDNGCKDPSASVKTWSKILAGSKKGKNKLKGNDSDDDYPLPIQTYATLKDKQMKEMLHEYGLPVIGNRSIWEQRHRRWVMLYNSNLDRGVRNRKTKMELRKELKKWEDDMLKRKKIVVGDVVDYQLRHREEFVKLIEEARPGKEQERDRS